MQEQAIKITNDIEIKHHLQDFPFNGHYIPKNALRSWSLFSY